MDRAYNFNAGPAALPQEVLETAAAQMLNYENTGMSVMEMSHRAKMYEEIIGVAELLLRELMGIPESYSVLFQQGGASTQFAMVPLNLMKSGSADFADTGFWSSRAIAECRKFGEANVVASSGDTYGYIPVLEPSKFNKNADYFHITHNNTIFGTRMDTLPETGGVPLVVDMSSSILSEAVDVNRFGLIYAGAQKNIGPSGLTVVVIRKDLITESPKHVPTMLSYKTYADNGSMYNTPPTYAIYIAMLVFRWLKKMGGVSEMERINKEKAALLYDFLDNARLFTPNISPPHRSRMNVTFTLPDKELTARFIKEAEKNGFEGLKGHRATGGLRASLYNAVPLEWAKKLVEFMKKFETENMNNV